MRGAARGRRDRRQPRAGGTRCLCVLDHGLRAGVPIAGGGHGLGAQAGQMKLTEVINAGGFTQVRRAAETPLNMILEARDLVVRPSSGQAT